MKARRGHGRRRKARWCVHARFLRVEARPEGRKHAEDLCHLRIRLSLWLELELEGTADAGLIMAETALGSRSGLAATGYRDGACRDRFGDRRVPHERGEVAP